MKAISPVRAARSCGYRAACCVSEQSLGISRSKHASLGESLSALCDMNDCYSRLRELVPSIPRSGSVSQVEILQHVIDYIFDLQIALEEEEQEEQEREGEEDMHGAGGAGGAPKVLLSIKTADISRNFTKEDGRLCH